ncbi:MAG: DNA/RNA nuclease SfsA [Clostridiaceae bacterium]|nr:DNA/RNA nuclease SfsA [Clostridiaceae bacterium]
MKIDGPTIEGVFVKRLNRFEAVVNIGGTDSIVHVPNTGRLKELLVAGARVLVRVFDNHKRKTRYGLLLVKKNGIWVSIDSGNVPNRIMYEALLNGDFKPLEGYEHFKREVLVQDSRLDFGLFYKEREYYIEVKGVTLVENRKAFFPDAPTVRGTRHLEELRRLREQGKGAGVIFIIQREDADLFMPNDRMDPDFGIALRKAFDAGVDIWAYTCTVDCSQIKLEKEVPVYLD